MTHPDTVEEVGSRFRLERKLGAGGQGEAWLAYDERLRRRVVLKRLVVTAGPSAEAGAVQLARAEREARAAGNLRHPGIVTVFDQFADHRGVPWMVMEYVEGRSLRDAVASGPLAVVEAARIGAQVASALAAAHAAGVVHRDVKPANILLAGDRAVVADFGIASVPDEVTITATHMPPGTPQFMAPEQVGNGASSPASDMWSLGVTLYCAVEGRFPFPGESVLQVLLAVGRGVPEPMTRAGALAQLIGQLLRTAPEERPAAAVAAASLREVAQAADVSQATDVSQAVEVSQAVGAVAAAEATGPGPDDIDELLRRATRERDRGDVPRAEDTYWSALDLAIRLHARLQEGWAWDGLGSCRWRADDPDMALRFYQRAACIAEETRDPLMRAWSLHNFGTHRRKKGEPEAARGYFEQALAVAEDERCTAPAGWTHHQLAELAAEDGDPLREKEHYAAAVHVARGTREEELAGWSLYNLARCEERAGDLPAAREHYAGVLEVGARIPNRWMVEHAEEALGRTAGPG
ncbi:protein kinase domain-containing protein [Streptomyces sp. NRRL B-24484]|uniref:serine/threonine-protein kinase n=1 Tax=Streptomyces sp. NRRL B-24484 TaxID=1463833 RepID=UPI000694E73F|nr:serine/threonine-protein kinase [Streptomyces sp. NRRL B-24484]